MRVDLIEPPTAAQVAIIFRSALHQADERAVTEVAPRLARAQDCLRWLDALVFTDLTGTGQDDGAAVDGDGEDAGAPAPAELRFRQGDVANIARSSDQVMTPEAHIPGLAAVWSCQQRSTVDPVGAAASPGGAARLAVGWEHAGIA
ncbi:MULTISPECIES: hypothetical protein [Streptomyces albovinaceus subgroup]|uniref:hypothetical protein n=1 Tax=Streptomyces TaxID=1883 RepID=UPI0004C6798C|nr:hypothetical protein [Streptomyces mediolani]